jgi:hypothetical protein
MRRRVMLAAFLLLGIGSTFVYWMAQQMLVLEPRYPPYFDEDVVLAQSPTPGENPTRSRSHQVWLEFTSVPQNLVANPLDPTVGDP